MPDYGAQQWMVPGEAHVFQPDVQQRIFPLEQELQRQQREDLYRRQQQVQQQRENESFLRQAFEFNPDVILGQYQPYIANRVKNEFIPKAIRTWRGNQQPTDADLQDVYKTQNDILRDTKMINDLDHKTQLIYQTLKEDKNKAGEIAQGPAQQKLKNVIWNPDNTPRKPSEIDFSKLDNFFDDHALKNLGAMSKNYLNTLADNIATFSYEQPSAYGNVSRKIVSVTAPDIFKTRINPYTRQAEYLVPNGMMVPEISDKYLFMLRKDRPDIYDEYEKDAELESRATNSDVSIKDIAQRYVSMYLGVKNEEKYQNIPQPKDFNLNIVGGIDPKRIPMATERYENVMELIKTKDQALLERVKAGKIDGQQIVKAEYTDPEKTSITVTYNSTMMGIPQKIVLPLNIDNASNMAAAADNINDIINYTVPDARKVTYDELHYIMKKRLMEQQKTSQKEINGF
jgi:hypothetical protein